MSSTANIHPVGADHLAGTLAGMGSKWEDLDPRARQQVALLTFGRRSNARPPLSVLMQDAVALAGEVLDADFRGVAELHSDGHGLALKLTPGAAGEASSEVLAQESSLSADSTCDDSMAVYTLNAARPIVADDLIAEKRFTDLFLRRLGVQSALNVPLHLHTEPCGVLGLYRKQKLPFTPDDVQFAETIASLLVASIARVKAEEALSEQQAFASAVLAMVEEPVISLDPQGRVLSVNRACEQTTGFAAAEVRGKPFCNVFAVPEEIALVEGVLRRATGGQTACKFESRLLAKDGSRRHVAWVLRVMYDRHRRVQSLVLSGVAHTEQPQPFQKVGEAKGTEQRSSPRRVFQHQQWVGPMFGSHLPRAEEFFEVVCEDISAGGLSFHLDRLPRFQRLVVALGKPPALTYFTADVVRVIEKTIDGRKSHLVGCRFTGRIQWDGPDPTAD